MKFEWDSDKNTVNLRVHGISFEEAAQVFRDPLRSITVDGRENYGEERLTTFGMIDGRLFSVSYTDRGDATRLISARPANRRERKWYEEGKDDDFYS